MAENAYNIYSAINSHISYALVGFILIKIAILIHTICTVVHYAVLHTIVVPPRISAPTLIPRFGTERTSTTKFPPIKYSIPIANH